MLRVAHIIPALRYGGAEKLVVTLAQEAAARTDIELTVITLRESNEQVRQAVIETGTRLLEPHHRKVYNVPRLLKLYRLIKQHNFDVIHTHLSMANILGGYLGGMAGIPVVTTLHNTKINTTPRRKLVETWGVRRYVSTLVAVGEQVEVAHKHLYPNKRWVVIPNAVSIYPLPSPSEKAALRAQIMHDPHRQLLIAVGRLETQKAHTDMLTALHQLLSTNSQCELIIVGIGKLEQEIRRTISRLGLENHVTLLGLRHDVPQLLSVADIYLNSSHWEGLPLTLLEAMAAGLPIVATDAGDTARVVSHDMGFITPVGALNEFASAIGSLLHNNKIRVQFGKRGREHIGRNYNASQWVDKLVELYQHSAYT